MQGQATDPPDSRQEHLTGVTLYRCPTPTNLLCACGRAARELNALGIEYETVRVPYRRGKRQRVEELSGQRLVPVLVDGDEVVNDSKRIVDYLQQR